MNKKLIAFLLTISIIAVVPLIFLVKISLDPNYYTDCQISANNNETHSTIPKQQKSSDDTEKDIAKDKNKIHAVNSDNNNNTAAEEIFKGIPKKIHQVTMNGMIHSSSQTAKDSIFSFISNNQDYAHKLWWEEDIKEFFPKYYPNEAKAILGLPLPILIADMFRYYAVLKFGGFYSDLDTICLKSLNGIWKDKFPNATAIIGVECTNHNNRKCYTYRGVQITQWTFAFTPNHPLLDHIIKCISKRMFSKTTEEQKGLDAGEWSGPGTFTDCTNEYLTNNKYLTDFNREVGSLTEATMFKDVLILPLVYFGNDQSLYVHNVGYGNSRHENAYIKHLFLGTWKKKN